MVTKILGIEWVENEDTNDVFECLVSDDKFELIEMVVDRIKSIEVGESVVVNFVSKADEEERDWMADCDVTGTDSYVKSETIYTNETKFNNN